ncbi:hypothetical protein [Flavitalea sp.]|nr:hypothetical protein [Flavitalea sp.]
MFFKNNIKRFLSKAIRILPMVLISSSVFSQVYTNKEVGKKNEDLRDSLANIEYPYALPILGKKVAKLGYNLPYSAGIGVNVFWQKSDLVIEDLKVGFNNGQPYDLDEIIRFNQAVSEATAFNIRPDVWILPFLNVYGIVAAARPSTAVGFGIYVPDSSNNWKEVTSYSTKANFNSTTVGFGLTPTMGVGGGWIALDMNFTWTDVSALDKPVFSFVFGPRLGKSFKLKKPEQNVALWVGGFRVKYGAATNGSIAISDVIEGAGEAAAKIDAGQQKVAETQAQIDTWWNGLTPPQQNNPINEAKYETANRTLAKAANILTAAEGALGTANNSTIQYSLNKRVKDMWNFIVGGQFQLNKHWMVRAEYGFLGSRQQFIGGLQYRFGL